jgi:hypothetical protein
MVPAAGAGGVDVIGPDDLGTLVVHRFETGPEHELCFVGSDPHLDVEARSS